MADIAPPESMDEINAQRIAAGLAPIGMTDSGGDEEPAVDEDIVAAQNYAKRKEEAKRAKAEQDTKERIAKVQNQRALNAKLKGSTLGDSGRDDSLDNAAWLKKLAKRQKKREQEIAARKAREMEEADRAAYEENDLAGLKVGHGAEDFETGEDVILTLQDQRVLDDEGEILAFIKNITSEELMPEDTLQNVNMVDKDKDKAAKDRKRKALEQYTGYDDDEFDEDRIGRKAEILGKYNDEFSSGKSKGESFRLGAAVEKKPEIEDGENEMMTLGSEPAHKVKLNLDFVKDFEVSDYMKEGDKGFKQRKKRKAKSSRKQDNDEEMAVEGEPTFERRKVEETPQNLVDDDDLQAALASKRRQELKKKQKVKPEDIAAKVVSQRQQDEARLPEENGDEDGRITFDDTSEFVRNVSLESRAIPVKRERAATPPVAGPSSVPVVEDTVVVKIERREEGEADEDEDMDSEDEDEGLAEMAAREGLSLAEYRSKIDSQMAEMETVKAEGLEAASTEEAVVGSGMAGVLNLLRQQGALKKQSDEEAERERIQKQRDLWLADYRRRQAQRELERIQARGGNKDQAQREWENRNREMNEARDALEVYKNYKPDVNIVYHDEFGRQMTPKEAWKSLSHKFHGKTTGRMKTEKRLKKIADERKQLQMSAGDTPLGMTEAFARRQQKTGQAHMVLSVGNKGSVQSDEQKAKIRR